MECASGSRCARGSKFLGETSFLVRINILPHPDISRNIQNKYISLHICRFSGRDMGENSAILVQNSAIFATFGQLPTMNVERKQFYMSNMKIHLFFSENYSSHWYALQLWWRSDQYTRSLLKKIFRAFSRFPMFAYVERLGRPCLCDLCSHFPQPLNYFRDAGLASEVGGYRGIGDSVTPSENFFITRREIEIRT